MAANQKEWEEKHRASAESGVAEPATIVRELLPILPPGPVLDLACGTGRHSLLLAAHHQPVTAIDWSSVALDVLTKNAEAQNLSAGRDPNGQLSVLPKSELIFAVQADLDQIELPENYFAVVLCVQYLQRSLFPAIEKALRPGGILVFETFTKEQMNLQGGPKNPAYLLEPGELRTAFPKLRTLFYRELCAQRGIASLIAQKPKAAANAA